MEKIDVFSTFSSPIINICAKNLRSLRFPRTEKNAMQLLRRGHANLLCIVPILVYVQPKLARLTKKQASYLSSY